MFCEAKYISVAEYNGWIEIEGKFTSSKASKFV